MYSKRKRVALKKRIISRVVNMKMKMQIRIDKRNYVNKYKYI